MNVRRLISVLAAFVMTVVLIAPDALSEMVEGVKVVSAPLRRSSSVLDGMVRVLLKDMGFKTHLDVTVTGNYSVNGNTAMALTTGDTVSVDFDTATGKMIMTMDGEMYDMGTEMRLRRHQADGDSAVSIAQATRPNNLYPGDLQLLAVEKNGAYQLYPILHVYLEYYLQGVVPYEMSSSNPLEALKAQAVAARTYTLRQMNARASYTYDLDDTSSYQVYKGHTSTVTNATRAVEETKGIVIMNDGKLSGTYYTASNGGQTEAVKNAWGSTGYAYLGVKDDPFDAMNTGSVRRRLSIYTEFDHASQSAALKEILNSAVQAKYGANALIQTIDGVLPHTPKYPAPSRLYTKMDFMLTILIGGVEMADTLTFSIFGTLEAPLSMSINGGQNELWTVEPLDGGFRLTVGRWGHGIGMSQRGAQQMGKLGYTYDQILGFYFEGCERVQFTFTHTILPVGSSNDIVSTEPPASFTPSDQNQASVMLPGVKDIVPLRYLPSENGKILTGIPNGGVVTVLTRGENWCLVRYGEINGYLPTSQLIINGTPEETGGSPTNITSWGVVTGTNALNFRTGPGYDYAIQTELASGTVLCILEDAGNWVKVQHGSKVGYVSPDYLTIHTSYPDETNADNSAMVSLPEASGSVPLLASPSTGGSVLWQAAHGVQVTVLSNDGSWCRVKVAGLEGYLLTSQLDFDATGVTPTNVPENPGMNAIVNTNSSALNLRAEASTGSAILTQIPKGASVIVTEYGEEWCAITWGEWKGYVKTEYLLIEEEETPTPTPTESASPSPSPSESASPSPSPTETTPPTETAAWVNNLVSYTNLRAAAGMDADIITRIPSGDEVAILEFGRNFCYVRHGVATGYVLTSNLTTVKSAPAIGIMFVNTENDPLIMRDHADIYDSKIVTQIPKGERVLVLEELKGWVKVQYGAYVGYCVSDYLTRRRPTEYEEDDTPIYDPSLVAVIDWQAVINLEDDEESLSIYKWCAEDSPELTTVPNGNTVPMLAMGEIWCKITFEGETGYCLTEKLIMLAPKAE